MAKYEIVAIPFQQRGNRQALSRLQIEEWPEFADFIKRFPNCFERDVLTDWFIFYPDGDSPNPVR